MNVEGIVVDLLQKEIDQAARTVRTDHYDLSIGEITSMYEDDEIQINPEFQRLFRWSPEQKSKASGVSFN